MALQKCGWALYPFSAVGNNVLFMHKSVVTNNVYIEHSGSC